MGNWAVATQEKGKFNKKMSRALTLGRSVLGMDDCSTRKV